MVIDEVETDKWGYQWRVGHGAPLSAGDGRGSAPASARPGITLVLGGGGARGLAHIGVLRVLEQARIPVAAIAGTSMGGLLGAYFAAGIPLEEVEADIVRLSRPREVVKLLDLGWSASGLSIKGVRLYELLAQRLGRLRFADLSIPLAVVAVDLRSGREVVLREGSILDAMRATISMPWIFQPVRRDNLVLADGGLLNNLPVDLARSLAGGPVVAVDVLPWFRGNQPGAKPVAFALKYRFLPRFLADPTHLYVLMIAEMTALRLQAFPPDLIIRPDLPADVTLLTGFDRAGKIIEAGRAAMEVALPTLQGLLPPG